MCINNTGLSRREGFPLRSVCPVLRSILLYILFCILSSALLGVFFSQESMAKEYVVMTEDFAPFGYREDGKLTGLSVEIVREVLKTLSHPDNIEVLPWARAYRETLNKPNRVVFSMARSPDREALFKWVGPLIADRIFFYKRRGAAIEIDTLDDAKKVKRIVLTRDFPEHRLLQSQGFSNLYLTVKPIQNFKMLMERRGDLVPMGELAVPKIIKEIGMDPTFIERTSVMLFETKLYIAFSNDIPDSEVQRWQSALDHVKATGKQAEIIKKYVIE